MLRPIQRIYPLEIRSNENLQRGMEESIPTVSETLSHDEDPSQGKPSTVASAMGHKHKAWRADWQQVVFSDEPTLICGTRMAPFVLDAMPVNAQSQSAGSNVIVAEHQELWSGMRFHNMDDLSC
ncbi:hypothetical protein TNCV_276651 [Trichonephila clavipes]|nr:hypothetical protein TNCV_276651 [Trichonephila clavipes]